MTSVSLDSGSSISSGVVEMKPKVEVVTKHTQPADPANTPHIPRLTLRKKRTGTTKGASTGPVSAQAVPKIDMAMTESYDTNEDDSSSTVINNSMDSDHASSPSLKPPFQSRPAFESDLHSDIAAVASPMTHMSISSMSNQEVRLKYFTFGAIILPSLIAVVLPSRYWGDESTKRQNSTSVDVANFLTNGVTVFLIGWIIKFIIEWPWDWFNQLKAAKLRLITHLNTSLQVENQFDFPSDSTKLKSLRKILLLKKLIRLEKVALAICLFSSLFGSAMMYAAKRVIIINFEDEFRRAIVFNNANVLLFQCWSIFRLALTISNDFSSKNPEDDSNEFTLNEANLGLFLSDQSSVWNNFVSKLPSRRSSVSTETASLSAEPQPNQISEANIDRICSYLEQSSSKQKHLIKKMVNVQNHKMKDLTNNLLKIEDTLANLKKISINPTTPRGSPPPSKIPNNAGFQTEYFTPYTGVNTPYNPGTPYSTAPPSPPTNTPVYVKPFPLNYSPDEKKQKFAATSTLRMNTIQEESGDDECSLSSPIVFSSSDSSTPIVQESGYNDIQSYREAVLSPPPQPYRNIKKGTRFYDYDDVLDTIDEERERSMEEFNRSMLVASLVEVKYFLIAIFNKLSLEVLVHPTQLLALVKSELNPRLLKLSNDNVVYYKETSVILKLLVWELLSAYVFTNFVPLDELIGSFDEMLLPFKRLLSFGVLISLRIPFNVLRFFITVFLFVPKISFKAFVLYPLLFVMDKLDPSHNYLRIFYPFEKKRLGDVNSFTGMKLFHLQSSQEKIAEPKQKPQTSISNLLPNEPSGLNRYYTPSGNLKTRAAVLHKLSKHFDLDDGELFSPGSSAHCIPVELSGEI